MKFPGNVYAGARIRTPVSLVDVVPTLLAFVGEPVPEILEGQDLNPHVRDSDTTSLPVRTLFFDLDVQTRDGTVNMFSGVLHRQWKWIRQVRPQPGDELFHLAKDRSEQNNLYDERQEVASELGQLLLESRSEAMGGVHVRLLTGGEESVTLLERKLTTPVRFEDERPIHFGGGKSI